MDVFASSLFVMIRMILPKKTIKMMVVMTTMTMIMMVLMMMTKQH